jgi:hypothetical protein
MELLLLVCPTEQLAHAALAALGWYFPTGQAIQVESPLPENLPEAQSSQSAVR